jgi:Flp pilus assembly protein TadG
MTRRILKIRSDEIGAAAIELAIALPVLLTMIYGIFSIGYLFLANAGIQHALGQGARQANLCAAQGSAGCTLPTAGTIKTAINNAVFGKFNGTWDDPSVDTTTASSGYITLTVTYHQTMSFAFFDGPTINLSRSKRVYLADTPPTKTACDAAATPAPACSIYTTT